MITKIISSGQTGICKNALLLAKELGLETGGCAPVGYKTKSGYDTSLLGMGVFTTKFGIYSKYKTCTLANADISDGTVWIGSKEGGYKAGAMACSAVKKPFIANPSKEEFAQWVKDNNITVLNVFGHADASLLEFQQLIQQALIINLIQS